MSTDTESALARTVLIHGPISRAALAVRMGMSPASLTRLTKPFLDRGVFVELDEVAEGVGRGFAVVAHVPQRAGVVRLSRRCG